MNFFTRGTFGDWDPNLWLLTIMKTKYIPIACGSRRGLRAITRTLHLCELDCFLEVNFSHDFLEMWKGFNGPADGNYKAWRTPPTTHGLSTIDLMKTHPTLELVTIRRAPWLLSYWMPRFENWQKVKKASMTWCESYLQTMWRLATPLTNSALPLVNLLVKI